MSKRHHKPYVPPNTVGGFDHGDGHHHFNKKRSEERLRRLGYPPPYTKSEDPFVEFRKWVFRNLFGG